MKELPPHQPSQSIKISDSVLENVQIAQAGRDLNLTQIQGEVGSLTVFGTVQVAQASPEVAKPISREEYRRRKVLLGRVKQDWIEGALKGALHTKVLIELGLEGRKDLVNNSVSEAEEFRFNQREIFSEDASANSIFEDIGAGRTLLILGEPGAGKTVTLLKLAESLVSRAESDLSQPLPVVMNLSSWAKQRLPMNKWLVQELSEKYHVSKPLGQTWIEQEQLLLLLDGLDEVDANHRNDCVKALNKFILEHGLTEIVVCSRIQDYQVLSERLRLRSAIYVKPLTLNQIDRFIDQVGESLSSLKIALRNNVELQSFVSSPLILSIMSLAYKGYSVEALTQTQTIEEQRNKLFNTYIDRMFSRRGTTYRYSREKTLHWLVWIAKIMKDSSQTIFLIEQLQPTLLPSKSHRIFHRLISNFIFTATMGLIISISFGLVYIFTLPHNENTSIENFFLIPFYLFIGIPILTFTIGLLYAPISILIDTLIILPITRKSGLIKPIQSFEWSLKSAINASRTGISISTLLSFLTITVINFFYYHFNSLELTTGLQVVTEFRAPETMIMISIFGVTFGVFGGLASGLKDASKECSLGKNKVWSWKRSAIGMFLGVLIGPLLMFSASISPYSTIGLSVSAFVGIIYGLTFGLNIALLIIAARWGAAKIIKRTSRYQESNSYSANSPKPRKSKPSGFTFFRWIFSGLSSGFLGGIIGGIFWILVTPSYFRETIGQMEPPLLSFDQLIRALQLGLLIGVPSAITFGLVGARISLSKFSESWSWRKSISGSTFGGAFGLLTGFCFYLYPNFVEFILIVMLIASVFGISFGLTLAPLVGLIGGFKREGISVGNIPNQGIWVSAKISSIFGAALGIFFGLITAFVSPETASNVLDINNKLFGGILIGLMFYAPAFGLFFGGAACCKHISLRLMLTRKKLMPWKYRQFLDYTVDRLFMQQVGGGYVFIHRMLLEHFAELELPTK